MVAESTIVARLREGPLAFPPLQFAQAGSPLDLVATWDGAEVRFHADVSTRATPQLLAVAAQRVKSRAFDAKGESQPLLIVPYLSPGNLAEVEKLGLSALDLCGNGIIQVPGRWHIVRSGQPNRFRGTGPARGIYGGVTSLVARAFLLQPSFDRVSDLHEFIKQRGGTITLATVSKAVAGLESDLVVAREGKGLVLIQAQTLLENLRSAYRPPEILTRFSAKTNAATVDLVMQVEITCETRGISVIPSGVTSAAYRGALAAEPVVSFYCREPPAAVLAAAQLPLTPGRVAIGVEVLQTTDERVYFAPREIDGIHLASSVQTWLELATGDKRAQEVADGLRGRLLASGELD